MKRIAATIIYLWVKQSSAQTVFEKKHQITTPQSMTGRNIVQNIYGDFFEHGSQYTDFFSGTSQLYIAKFSNSGVFKWGRNYYNTQVGNNTLHAKGMIALNDGGFVIAGFVLSPDSTTDYDIMVARFDSSGSVSWSKMIGDSISLTDNEGVVSIIETTDGNFVVAGNINSPQPAADFYCKLTPAGNILWQKKFTANQQTSGCKNMVATANGGFAIGGNKLLLIKFDTNGNQLWKTVPDFPQTKAARATTICKTNDGGYAVAGIAGESNNGNVVGDSRDIAIAKYDSAGAVQWIKKYLYPRQDFPAVIMQEANNTFIIGGTHGDASVGFEYAVILKTDSAGNFQFAYEGPINKSCFYNMSKCADGGYILTGNSTNGTTFNHFPITIKTDSALTLPCFNSFVFTDSSYNLTSTHTGAATLTNCFYITRNFLLMHTDSNTVLNYCPGLNVGDVTSQIDFELFPNPASDFVTLQLPETNCKVAYFIRDVYGKIVHEKQLPANTHNLLIDVSDFSKGIYYIEINFDEKRAASKMFVVL